VNTACKFSGFNKTRDRRETLQDLEQVIQGNHEVFEAKRHRRYMHAEQHWHGATLYVQ
jgi:hypothetical protein